MSANKLFWGLLVIALGLLLFLNNLGVLPGAYVQNAWSLWPMLLIVWGVSLLIARTGRGATFFSALAALIIIASVVGVAWLAGQGKIGSQVNMPQTISQDSQVGVSQVNLSLKMGAADIKIDSGASKALEGSADTIGGVDIVSSIKADIQSIELKQAEVPASFFMKSYRNDLRIKLNGELGYKIKADLGASSFKMDLSDVKVSSLDLSTGATSGEIKFGEKFFRPEATISTGASSFTIKVPKNIGLVLYNNSGMVSVSYEKAGLKKTDQISAGESVYADSNYQHGGENSNYLTLHLKAGASSINIERY